MRTSRGQGLDECLTNPTGATGDNGAFRGPEHQNKLKAESSKPKQRVATLLAMEGGYVPATGGAESVDRALPPCRVAHTVERNAARRVLMVSESFGGRCAALVMERA